MQIGKKTTNGINFVRILLKANELDLYQDKSKAYLDIIYENVLDNF